MGMEMILAQVTSDQLEDFKSNPEGVVEFPKGNPGGGDSRFRMEAVAQAMWNRMGMSAEIREKAQQQWKSLLDQAQQMNVADLVSHASKQLSSLQPDTMQLLTRHLMQARNQVNAAKKSRLAKPDKVPAIQKELSLQKDWHVLHYVLNGTSEGGEGPLGHAVFGDAELVNAGDCGYGPPHYLTPEQVASVSAELEKVEPSSLLEKLDPADAEEKHIYLAHTLNDSGDWQYLPELFCKFRDFYKDATNSGNGIIMTIT
jgi:hypothetical protein